MLKMYYNPEIYEYYHYKKKEKKKEEIYEFYFSALFWPKYHEYWCYVVHVHNLAMTWGRVNTSLALHVHNIAIISSAESQKGINVVQQCSIENQKALSP